MKALILVDLQNDFAPSGALAVPCGDEVVAVANHVMPAFELVVATQDWHPANHGSFASNHPGRKVFEAIELAGQPQTLWPDHCVQNTGGALFIPGLDTRRITRVFPKGTDAEIDSYSGFFDNGHRRATGLGEFLAQRGVTEVYVMGLATDYCVKATALDARKLGFAVKLIVEGVRGVELTPGDSERAIEEMQNAGVEVVSERTISAITATIPQQEGRPAGPVTFIFRDFHRELIEEWKRQFADVPNVTTEHGEIFGARADAIVSPANSFGFMDGGIDMVYSRRFGWGLQDRLQQMIREERGGELPVGDALILPTGEEEIPFLVSAPTMRVPLGIADTTNVYLAFRAVLQAVDRHNATHPRPITSVLCPGLGTGIGRVSGSVCAKQMRRAYERHYARDAWFPTSVRAAAEDYIEMLHGN